MLAWVDSIATTTTLIEWPHFVRLSAAIFLGGLIGLERELRDKPAGFRTIILICLGACIFTILSQALGGPDWNATRIAAQIVSGIGFLGAGAILREKHGIMGLTTAATIWSVAAIGMAAGFGRIGLAAVGTAGILMALLLFNYVEGWIGDRRDLQEYRVQTANTPDCFEKLEALFQEHALNVRKSNWHEEDATLVIHVVAMGAKTEHDRLRRFLAQAKEYTLRPT